MLTERKWVPGSKDTYTIFFHAWVQNNGGNQHFAKKLFFESPLCLIYLLESLLLREFRAFLASLTGCRSISLIQFAQTGSANPWVLRVLSAKFVSAKAFECIVF